MLGGADNPNGELPSYITGANKNSDTGNKQAYRNEDGYECIAHLLVPAKGFNT
ncbi:TPA: hypothetical protein JTO26_004566 [Escherichia coli]|nr:hypothetical protein [Escherichia coli]